MKINYLLLFFLLISSTVFSQKKKSDADTAYTRQIKIAEKIVRRKQNDGDKIASVDSLLVKGCITIPSIIGGLYAEKAKLYYWKNKALIEKLRENAVYEEAESSAIDTTADYLYLPVKNAFQKAMDTCKKCNLSYIIDRYEYLEDLNVEPAIIKNDLETLKQHGYKEQYNANFLSAYTRIGNYAWYGIEASVTGIHVPSYRISETDVETKKKTVLQSMYPVMVTAPTVAFEIKDGKNYGFNFSLVQWSAPLSFNLTRFGFLKSEGFSRVQWFYRPEIGLGWNYFSFGYAYNLMLKKTDRKDADKHFFVARVTVPLYKFK